MEKENIENALVDLDTLIRAKATEDPRNCDIDEFEGHLAAIRWLIEQLPEEEREGWEKPLIINAKKLQKFLKGSRESSAGDYWLHVRLTGNLNDRELERDVLQSKLLDAAEKKERKYTFMQRLCYSGILTAIGGYIIDKIADFYNTSGELGDVMLVIAPYLFALVIIVMVFIGHKICS